jgi:tetratricopeptide (TPR) repeat protein
MADEPCSVTVFEADPAKAAANCTSILHAGDLTSAQRAEALKIRARSLHAMKHLDDAIRDYEEALKLAPDDAELHVRRGWTAYDKKDYEQVFAQADRALQLRPDYAEVYELIGVTLSQGGRDNLAQAKAAEDRAIELEPHELLYRLNHILLLELSGSLNEAIDEAEAFLRQPPELIAKSKKADLYLRPETYRTFIEVKRAIWLKAVGRIKDATQAYDHAVDLDPDPLTYAVRAEFRLTQSRFDPTGPRPTFADAQDDLDKAFALDSNYWLAQNLQAKLLRLRGEYGLAAEYYAKAVQGFPINGTLRWNYAATLRQLGRTEEAVAEAVKAIQSDPGFMQQKLGYLEQRGYLASFAPDVDPRPVVMDAVRACMLDERCQ